MTMLLSHRAFLALPTDQQLPVVWQQGRLVAERQAGRRVMELYAVGAFFFEIHYSQQTGDIRHTSSFRGLWYLDAYLRYIHLPDLTGLLSPSPLVPPPVLNPFSTTGPAGNLRISVATDFEVRYWTRALGCTKPQLYAAIAAVGPMMLAVRKHLAT
jgi:hypothetical protein